MGISIWQHCRRICPHAVHVYLPETPQSMALERALLHSIARRYLVKHAMRERYFVSESTF